MVHDVCEYVCASVWAGACQCERTCLNPAKHARGKERVCVCEGGGGGGRLTVSRKLLPRDSQATKGIIDA